MMQPLLELRPEVAAFAQLMEQKLRAHDRMRPGWKGEPPGYLFDRMMQETIELQVAMAGKLDEAAILAIGFEAADVGNFAMMCADCLGALPAFVPANAIARNQVITPAQTPGKDDSALETIDGAGDQMETIGPSVTYPKYTPPADKRVQAALREGAAARKASREPPPLRPTFSDPRLDPKYKPPKK